jgi:hypothetical protein
LPAPGDEEWHATWTETEQLNVGKMSQRWNEIFADPEIPDAVMQRQSREGAGRGKNKSKPAKQRKTQANQGPYGDWQVAQAKQHKKRCYNYSRKRKKFQN